MIRTIQHLFLIAGQADFEAARRLIDEGPLPDAVVLGIDPRPPFMTDEWRHLGAMASWREFGVAEFGLSRFWMRHYREIDAMISDHLDVRNDGLPDGMASPHFRFDLVWSLGMEIGDPLSELNELFRRMKSTRLYLRPAGNFIGRTLDALGRRHGMTVIPLTQI